jgi:hypothetical protein
MRTRVTANAEKYPAPSQSGLNSARRAKNREISREKPFDVLAEELLSEKSRGDKTAIELFVAGVRGWEAGLRRQFSDGKDV